MLNVTVTLTASQELLDALGNLFKGITAPQKVQKTPVKEIAQQAAPTAEPVATKEPLATASQGGEKITVEDLRAAVAEKAKAGKRDAIKNLLAKHNAESVSTLATTAYAEFKTELENI